MHRDVVFWSGMSVVSRWGILSETVGSRPIGAYQMAWWLRKHRFSAQVIEFVQLLTPKELYDITVPFITDKTICLGISRTFLGFGGQLPDNMIRVLWRLKIKFPKLKFVMGGQEAGFELRFPIDKHFTGFSEDSFLTWMQQQKQGVAFPNALFSIKDQEHRFIADDVILPGEALPIELGRGCIFSCKFCGYSLIGKEKGSYLRHHQHVIDEMKHNKDMFGTTKYMFLDDTSNEDYDKVKRFSNFRHDLGFEIGWVGYCRADLIWAKPESAEWLRESGLMSPHFGIETFHPKAAMLIGKGWSGKKGKDWLPKLHQDIWGGKINIRMTMITGLPHEPLEDIHKYVEYFKSMPSMGDMFFSALALGPPPVNGNKDTRSEFSKNTEKYGYKLSKSQTDEGLWRWTSKLGTSEEAAALAQKANYDTEPHCKVSSWHVASGLNLGYTVEETLAASGRGPRDFKNQRLNTLKKKYLTQFANHFSLPHLLPAEEDTLLVVSKMPFLPKPATI